MRKIKTAFNDGYTMIEAVISIAIMGMLLVPLSMVSKQINSMIKLKEKIILAEKFIKNESEIRIAIENRKISFWDKEFNITYDKNKIFMNGLYYSEIKLDDDVEILDAELLGNFPYHGIEIQWKLKEKKFITKVNFLGTASDD